MSSHSSDRLAKYVMGLYGPPAFAQRANHASHAWDSILEKCRKTRTDTLDGVRWALTPCAKKLNLTLDEDPVIAIEQIRTATSEKKLSQIPFNTRVLLHQLASAIERFNTKWTKYLDSTDLGHLNTLRDEFNQNFVIEKECATGSDLIARQGFVPVSSIDQEALKREYPLLKPMPRFLRAPAVNSPGIWGSMPWVAIMIVNVLTTLLLPTPDTFRRVTSVFYLLIVCGALLLAVFISQRKLRDMEDELDRLSQ